MKKFYTSAKDQLNHIDGIGIAQNVLSTIRDCSEDLLVFDRELDFFVDPFDEDDEALQVLRVCPADPVQLIGSMFVSGLEAIIMVLERQFARYFVMDLDDVLRKETESARARNINADEVVGLFSVA